MKNHHNPNEARAFHSGDLPKSFPGPGELFVGTCYQPVDRTPKQIKADVAIMRGAGFNVVRIGDLSWDYFEPAEGKFDFKRCDQVFDEMQANGIKVILDIPGLPAPQWLHHKYPGVDLVSQNGVRLHAAERYMDNISDPDYRRLASRMADELTRHYAHHPALFALGYDNEIGNGFMSYSEADRRRFVTWLKERYGDIATLNKVWARQRWSRMYTTWDEVQLPYGDGPGAPEPFLDLHRYWSDVTVGTLMDLEKIRRKNVPDKPSISNLWDTSWRKGFDLLGTHRGYVSYGAMGFYPGEPVSSSFEALMMKGALPTPIWFNEFTAGGGGWFGSKGWSRMWAYMGLLNGVQGILAWTFNSHLGGEEQALFGLVNHDDTPSWKVSEFGEIAASFKKLAPLGFPRYPHPQVAIAYSFDNTTATRFTGPSNTIKQYLTTSYEDQAHNAFKPLFRENIDVAVINIGHEDLSSYKMVVVPGLYLMDQASADAIRKYVSKGGTVIMTAFSAKVDEHNQWFNTPLPGRLSDVFGLKTNEFYSWGEPTVELEGQQAKSSIKYFEVLEPSTAHVMAKFTSFGENPPAITVNKFGKGQAIYVATPAFPSIMDLLYKKIGPEIGIKPGPKTPDGVYARVVDDRILYVNSTGSDVDIPIEGKMKGLISGKTWTGVLHLGGFNADLLQKESAEK
ncbi:beta-galactosidase [Fimbriimonas ginsengisoli]|uniref:beta-galactosidase n=1 Tax=Fimbriimonas ginsengisoli Gsoil 348 TaxID=661478 RepID=A0A068NJJ7_FIMGI|nr:beta-galactosidase [Fimbriimonas ginsengisoli]AIE83676.1 beta-galactosidase [Fimbriimonas ginsengisoli Gsoil 348]